MTDRVIVYAGASPLDTDILQSQQNTMIALGYALQTILGTSPVADGLLCAPTVPASLVVNVAPGSLTALTTIEPNQFGSVPPDTTDPLLKQGINILPTAIPLSAPTSSGQSIAYLIEAAFTEADDTALVLSYRNPLNPAVPFSGPPTAANTSSGTAQNTRRTQRVSLRVSPGAPANAGTQTPPAPDPGYVPLYVVTVAYGQTTITATSIAQHPQAPFLAYKLPAIPGRRIGTQGFGGIGTSTYTPTLGTKLAIVTLIGGGGAGGGAPATVANSYGVGGGGGSGGYARVQIINPAASTVVVGAGGIGVNGGTGGNGGSSSFAGTVVAAGGYGGSQGGPSTNFIVNPGGGGAKGTTGDIVAGGNPGTAGLAIGTSVIGGYGGASLLYGGAGFGSAGATGGNAQGAGAGGGGSSNQPSAGAVAGGSGAGGYVLIEEYS